MPGPSCAEKFNHSYRLVSFRIPSVRSAAWGTLSSQSILFLRPSFGTSHYSPCFVTLVQSCTKKPSSLCLYLSISLTRLCRRSFRSNILTSRISITLCTSLSMRSLSSKELANDCSALCTLRSSSTLRISSSLGKRHPDRERKRRAYITV